MTGICFDDNHLNSDNNPEIPVDCPVNLYTISGTGSTQSDGIFVLFNLSHFAKQHKTPCQGDATHSTCVQSMLLRSHQLVSSLLCAHRL
jgi:hypothetical protein